MARQKNTLNLVPSMTHTPPHLLIALLLPLQKWAGEKIKALAEKRWLEVFASVYQGREKTLADEYAVVIEPHSGSQANQMVDHILMKPGDKVMGMRTDLGGHLTHGHPLNASGVFFDVVPKPGESASGRIVSNGYGVDLQTGEIDYDELERLAKDF